MSPRQPARPQKIFVQPLLNTVTSDRPQVVAEFGEDCLIRGTLRYDGDRYQLIGIEFSALTHKNPSAEITATLLRQLEVSKFALAARQVLVMALEAHLAESPEDKAATGRMIPAIPENEARRKIRAASRAKNSNNNLDDNFYRRIALDLIELVESGKSAPGGVLATLAEIESRRLKRDVPVETLRTWIRIARERKFLAPGVRGRMNAEPGRRLYSANVED